jgi:peptidoglycan/LPS O-acetylase OafA/YrhL
VLRASRDVVRLIWIYLIGALLCFFWPLFLYFPCFLAGVIAYKLLGAVKSCVPAWFWCPALLGVVASYVQTPYSEARLNDALICLIVAGLIPLFKENSGAIASAASQIAKYSDGIYLCHTPVLWFLYHKMTIPDWQRSIWLVIATSATSMACYHLIEQPLIRVGTRLARRVSIKPKALAVAA